MVVRDAAIHDVDNRYLGTTISENTGDESKKSQTKSSNIFYKVKSSTLKT